MARQGAGSRRLGPRPTPAARQPVGDVRRVRQPRSHRPLVRHQPLLAPQAGVLLPAMRAGEETVAEAARARRWNLASPSDAPSRFRSRRGRRPSPRGACGSCAPSARSGAWISRAAAAAPKRGWPGRERSRRLATSPRRGAEKHRRGAPTGRWRAADALDAVAVSLAMIDYDGTTVVVQTQRGLVEPEVDEEAAAAAAAGGGWRGRRRRRRGRTRPVRGVARRRGAAVPRRGRRGRDRDGRRGRRSAAARLRHGRFRAGRFQPGRRRRRFRAEPEPSKKQKTNIGFIGFAAAAEVRPHGGRRGPEPRVPGAREALSAASGVAPNPKP